LPAEDFSKFLVILDNILKFLINPKSKIKVCGDIDVNYRINSSRKYQLNPLQNSYNLIDTVDFQQECNTHQLLLSIIYLLFTLEQIIIPHPHIIVAS